MCLDGTSEGRWLQVESVLPSEYFELKQMMELHMELKSQVTHKYT